jgi:glycosyltransferase involved in cell wall biosynthesis
VTTGDPQQASENMYGNGGYASLCFLSYNRPQFLQTAIETALLNAGAPCEVIVHDDGSTDEDVYDLLYSAQAQGVISTLIVNPPGHNQGQGVALNRLFNIASGDPIIKLDQDLIFEPNWLEKVNHLLMRNPRAGLLGLFKYEHDPVDYRKTRIATPDHARDGLDFHTHICGSGFALQRVVWEALGPFEEHSAAFAEDADMQRRVFEHPAWDCALPYVDLVRNQGFGIGPSTVVPAVGQVATFHTGPKLAVGEHPASVEVEPSDCISEQTGVVE